MKITEIRVYQFDLGVAGTYEMSLSEFSGTIDSTVVEVVTDDAISGFGETVPLGPTYQPQHALGARAALAEVSPALIGLDPTRTRLINHAMDQALNGTAYGKAAIDIACWDVLGKTTGMRVCDLLGGAFTDQVASWYGILPTTADDTVAQMEQLQDAGYQRIQIKAGGRSLDEDIAAMRAAASVRRPGTKLLADANRGWTTSDAISYSNACRDIPLILEQPCDTLDDHYVIAGKVAHPVYLDEAADSIAAVMKAIDDGIAQGFSMKGTRVGGTSAMRVIRDICDARRVPHTCDDTWAGDIGTAAKVHMGASVDPYLYEGTWIAEPYMSWSYPMKTDTIDGSTGSIDVPSLPGLGVIPDVDQWPDPVAVYS